MNRDFGARTEIADVSTGGAPRRARNRHSLALAAGVALFGLGSTLISAAAQDAPTHSAQGEPQSAPTDQKVSDAKREAKKPEFLPDASIATSLPPQFVDPGGLRNALFDKGIKYNLLYVGEFFGNFRGGTRPGAIGEGRLQLLIDVDLEKMVGWKGGTIHLDGQYIHGEGLSRYHIGNLNATSNIEALAATRLYEAYFEQQLIEGKLSVRAGQMAADTQFVISVYGSLFINSTFGFPQFGASNLPGGGPAFPLATPGAGLKFTPTDNFTFLAALYNGDPADPTGGDPQKSNKHGLDFRLQDAPLVFAEAQYKYNAEKDAKFLPGTIKVGGYNSFLRYPIGEFTPAFPIRDRGGPQGIYAVLDQQAYRLSADAPDKGVGMFVRASLSPNDASVVSAYADGGLNFSGLVPNRPDDVFGVSGAYTHISKAARDQDLISRLGTPGYPIRNFEGTIEVTYQALVVPGFTLQPDFQYSFHPGANAPNPRDIRGRPIKDAAIFGLRAAISY